MDDCPQLGPAETHESEAEGSIGREARRNELRAAVEQGLDDIKSGRVADLDEAFGRIEAMLDELEASKRA